MEEEDFPRGSGTKHSKSKGKIKHSIAPTLKRPARDELFKEEPENETPSKTKKRKKSKDKSETTETALEAEYEVLSKEIGMKARPLTQKVLNEGMLLLAAVKEIHDYEIVLSLPNGLTAFVQITDVSSFYTSKLQELKEDDASEAVDLPGLADFYNIGDLVPCKIKSLSASKDGHRRIQATLDYKEINSELSTFLIKPGMILHGCVSSVEDHGYTVDIGVKGARAFLGKQDAKKLTQIKGQDVHVGQLVTCLVKDVKAKGRSVILTSDPALLAKTKASSSTHTMLSTLLPGTRVTAVVTSVEPNCLCVDVMHLYKGCVDSIHLRNSSDELAKFKVEQKLDAVILYNCPSTKTLGLSLNAAHHKLTFDPDSDLFSDLTPGDVVEEATVVRVLKRSGLILQLTPNTRGIVYQSHLSDDARTKSSRYQVGEKVKCRILDFNLLDGLVMASMKTSILEKPFLGIRDIKPGMLVEGVIETISNKGLGVKVQDRVHGFVPRVHLADIPIQKPQERFTIGSEIELRVLLVEPSRRRVLLTHKKTLVKSSLPILTSYSHPRVGMWVHGCVVSVKDFGCIVTFYNDVKGIIPRSELGTDRSLSPTENFYVGQVLKCRVVRTHDPEAKKLLLSLKKDDVSEKDTFEAGKILKVRVARVKPEGLEVLMLPGNHTAFLPKMHLSDHPDNCAALLASYSEGDVIDPAMTWSFNPKTKTTIITRKPLLISASRNGTEIVRDFSELRNDMMLLGVMRYAMSYGVFVEFANNIVGLSPKATMSDDFVTDASKPYKVGQTLRAKVTEVNTEKKRFLVSLKMSDCSQEDDDTEVGLRQLEVYFREKDEAALLLSKKEKEYKHLSSLHLGSMVQASVQNTQGKGVVCRLPHNLDGVINAYHMDGNKPKVGDNVEACVLNVDLGSKTVQVSLLKHLVERHKKTSKLKDKKAKKAKKANKVENASVLLIKEDFTLVYTASEQCMYIPSKQDLNDVKQGNNQLMLGQRIDVEEKREVNGRIFAVSVHSDKTEKTKKSKKSKEAAKKPEVQQEHPPIAIGQVVNGVVRSVKGTQVNVEVDGGAFGRIHATEITDDMKSGQCPLETFSIGKKVTAKVIGYRYGKRQLHLPISHGHCFVSLLELSVKQSVMESSSVPNELVNLEEELNAYKNGQTVYCVVNRYDKDVLWVHLSRVVEGKVHCLNLSKHPSTLQHPETFFKPGHVHRAKVIRRDKDHNMLELTMSGNTSPDLQPGMVVNCKVVRVLENRVSVQLPFGHHGNAFITDISDVFTENPLEEIQAEQYLRCCILEIYKDGEVAVSLRPSRIKKCPAMDGGDKDVQGLGDLSQGQVVRGYVKHCSAKGVFVSLSRNVHGRILLKKLSSFYVEDPSAIFPTGKLITTKIISIDRKSGKVELSSSSQDTGSEDPVPQDMRKSKSKRKRKAKDDGNDSGLGEAEALSDTEAEIITVPKKSSAGVPRLQLASGFSWEDDDDDGDDDTKGSTSKTLKMPSRLMGVDDSSESEEEEDDADIEEPPVKKSKKEKEAEAKSEEDFLYKTEHALMDAERMPETAEDFDRLVVSSPNSSLAWIRYMAYYLHSVDIEKARAVAERALKTINFREEQEKLNVWVAYLNLENLYGSEEDVVAVFQRALQQCEAIKVFQQLVSIYIRTEKLEQAEQLYESMIKRFKFNPEVWIGYGTFLMRNSRHEQARRLMQRSFKSLVQKEHVSVIIKFAQLEYRHGEPERGKTMFENVLSNYPKRTDIWSIYLDMTIKQGDITASRHLFERVIHLTLSAKKIKFFFKRYLDFEKKYGDETAINGVKQQAVEYVESKTAVGVV